MLRILEELQTKNNELMEELQQKTLQAAENVEEYKSECLAAHERQQKTQKLFRAKVRDTEQLEKKYLLLETRLRAYVQLMRDKDQSFHMDKMRRIRNGDSESKKMAEDAKFAIDQMHILERKIGILQSELEEKNCAIESMKEMGMQGGSKEVEGMMSRLRDLQQKNQEYTHRLNKAAAEYKELKVKNEQAAAKVNKEHLEAVRKLQEQLGDKEEAAQRLESYGVDIEEQFQQTKDTLKRQVEQFNDLREQHKKEMETSVNSVMVDASSEDEEKRRIRWGCNFGQVTPSFIVESAITVSH